MRQRRWVELFSNYDCEIRYHSGKANIVADAFSRKERVKSRQVRAMSMTIQPSVKDKILRIRRIMTLEICIGLPLYKKDIATYVCNCLHVQEKLNERIIDHGVRAYHPQTDGQSERTIKTLEDMLRAYVIGFGGSWDTHLPLAESPVLWAEVEENRLIGYEMGCRRQTDKVILIKERLKAARDRQKSYVDNRRKPLKFEVGDQVLQIVSPGKVGSAFW
ncbi:putative reverse transcriptase domain-containing protein [Tanacetum coccineum]|uniref:Reverse transcriptase domain-containing protein n=1 Tax=Tanacetum coccineum TaxID=301880 RepID=A0ABQ4Y2G9_9ASTR